MEIRKASKTGGKEKKLRMGKDKFDTKENGKEKEKKRRERKRNEREVKKKSGIENP